MPSGILTSITISTIVNNLLLISIIPDLSSPAFIYSYCSHVVKQRFSNSRRWLQKKKRLLMTILRYSWSNIFKNVIKYTQIWIAGTLDHRNCVPVTGTLDTAKTKTGKGLCSLRLCDRFIPFYTPIYMAVAMTTSSKN